MGNHYRIAFYGHKSIPSREGGIEVVVQELSVRLANLGHMVFCINRGGDHSSYAQKNDLTEKGYYKGVKLIKVPTIDKGGLAAVSSSFFAAFKAAFGPYDIVHIHAEGPAAFCMIPKAFGKKIVVTIHGLDWQRDKWHGFAKKYIHFGEKMAARFADALIVLSSSMGDYFVSTYGRQTIYIPNGTELSELKSPEEIVRKFNLDKDGYILYLGRLVPEKRADLLIRAFKSVKTTKRLVIAGPLNEKDTYHRQLKELASDDARIMFTGFVSGATLQELYSNAYIYVLPSKLEGMPLSLLEAMSYGCCCVTSDIPECKEVVGSQGLLVDPDNAEQLTQMLQSLIDDPASVAEYRKQTLDLIRTKCSWDEVTLRTAQLYEQLMEMK